MKSRRLVLLFLINVFLNSCGGGGGGGSAAAPACSATKDVFSTWTSREAGNPVFIMGACAFNTNCQVLFGAAPCNDGRGDFNIYITPSGRMGFSNCADTVGIDGADWSISCSNVLSITYDSDSSVELLD